jgi:hypothetical protein
MASAAWQGKPSYAPGAVTTVVLGCPAKSSLYLCQSLLKPIFPRNPKHQKPVK